MARVVVAVAATSAQFKHQLKGSNEAYAVPLLTDRTAVVSWSTIHNVTIGVYDTQMKLLHKKELTADIHGTIDANELFFLETFEDKWKTFDSLTLKERQGTINISHYRNHRMVIFPDSQWVSVVSFERFPDRLILEMFPYPSKTTTDLKVVWTTKFNFPRVASASEIQVIPLNRSNRLALFYSGLCTAPSWQICDLDQRKNLTFKLPESPEFADSCLKHVFEIRPSEYLLHLTYERKKHDAWLVADTRSQEIITEPFKVDIPALTSVAILNGRLLCVMKDIPPVGTGQQQPADTRNTLNIFDIDTGEEVLKYNFPFNARQTISEDHLNKTFLLDCENEQRDIFSLRKLECIEAFGLDKWKTAKEGAYIINDNILRVHLLKEASTGRMNHSMVQFVLDAFE